MVDHPEVWNLRGKLEAKYDYLGMAKDPNEDYYWSEEVMSRMIDPAGGSITGMSKVASWRQWKENPTLGSRRNAVRVRRPSVKV